MNWLLSPDALRRQTQLELLRALPRDIPGVSDAADSAAAGSSISLLLPAIHDAWRKHQRQVEAQAWELERLRRQAGELQQEVARWQSRPVEQMLRDLRTQVETLTQRAAKAEQALAWTSEQHARELAIRDQEIARLQALTTEQNRVITRLHRDLHGQSDDVHKT